MLPIRKADNIEYENITNVQALKRKIDDIPLSDDSIDIVLASLALHEVKPLSQSLQQIKQVLKEDGYFVCGIRRERKVFLWAAESFLIHDGTRDNQCRI